MLNILSNFKHKFGAVCCLSLLLIPCIGESTVPNSITSFTYPGKNLVENGSFENNYSDFHFEAWFPGFANEFEYFQPPLFNSDISPYNGQRMAAIQYLRPTDPAKHPFYLSSEIFKVKPGQQYTLFFRYQTENLSYGTIDNSKVKPAVHVWKAKPFVYLPETRSVQIFLDENGNSYEVNLADPSTERFGAPYQNVSSWTLYTHYFTAGPEALFANIHLLYADELGVSGNFYFDDVVIVEGHILEPDINNPGHPEQIGITRKFKNGKGNIIQTSTQIGNKDIVTQNFYDNFNRIKKATLPLGADFGPRRHQFISGITANTDPQDATDSLNCFYRGSGSNISPCPGEVPLDVHPITGASIYYPDANEFAFSEVIYEDSPLGRELEAAGSGESWQSGSGHSLRSEHYTVSSLVSPTTGKPWDEPPRPIGNNGKFFATQFTDVNGQITREYSDQRGNLVQKSSKLINSTGTHWVHTQYKYDGNGNLTKIISPEGPINVNRESDMVYNSLNQMVQESTPSTGTTIFKYDPMGRPRFSRTAKQLANNRFSFVKYDNLGRIMRTGEIVAIDSAEMEANFSQANADKENYPEMATLVDAALFTRNMNHYDNGDFPDDMNCAAVSQVQNPVPNPYITYVVDEIPGIMEIKEFSTLNSAYDVAVQQLEASGNFNGVVQILAIYPNDNSKQFLLDNSTQLNFKIDNPSSNLDVRFKLQALEASDPIAIEFLRLARLSSPDFALGSFLKGRLVKSVTCNYELEFEPDIGLGQISKVFDYDEFGNTTRIFSQNTYMRDAAKRWQLTQNKYDVLNRLTQKTVCNGLNCPEEGDNSSVDFALSHREKYFYDQAGRIDKIEDKNGNIILDNHYNNIGELSFQGLGGAIEQNPSDNRLLVEYKYHLHGWIKEIDVTNMNGGERQFRETLLYEDAPNVRYDGNKGRALYDYASDITPQFSGYDYQYDDLNRLIDVQTDPFVPGKEVAYDYFKDGRLAFIDRGGNSGTFEYNEKGQLENVEGNLIPGRPLSSTTLGEAAFVYDSAGNIEFDKSKREDGLDFKATYRFDNLPNIFHFKLENEQQSGNFDEFKMYMIYSGEGNRVSKITFQNNQLLSIKSYFGSGKEIRESDIATDFNQLAGVGRVKYTSQNPNGIKEYYLKDNLGTTREVFDFDQGKVTYAYLYHPYGKQDDLLEGNSENITEKFTGHELDEGIQLTYAGARYYDADIALWTSPDPGRQFHSLYAYAGNGMNPINAVDPDGRSLTGYGWTFQNRAQLQGALNSRGQVYDATLQTVATVGLFFPATTAISSYYLTARSVSGTLHRQFISQSQDWSVTGLELGLDLVFFGKGEVIQRYGGNLAGAIANVHYLVVNKGINYAIDTRYKEGTDVTLDLDIPPIPEAPTLYETVQRGLTRQGAARD